MKSAVKLNVQVGADHIVKLPDEVPEGPVEIIVLMEQSAEGAVLDDFEPVQAANSVRLSDIVIEGRG